jgi:hypothetical protein
MILTSCGHTNLLTYKYKRYYYEHREFKSDTTFKIDQYVWKDKPIVTHDEFAYQLTLTIMDTISAKVKRNIDLETDTLVVKSRYGIFSMNDFGVENNKITGQIKILSWKKNSIRIKERIYVTDLRRKETKKYKGTRSYKRKASHY